MKKVLAWVCGITGVALLGFSSSLSIMNKVWAWNRVHAMNTSWYGKDFNYQWGDLANMALLDGISKYREPGSYNFVKPSDDGNKNIDLYVFGDSHTEAIPAYAYANINEYHYGRTLAYTLDPSKKSILILEVSEKDFQGWYHNTGIYSALHAKDDPHPIIGVHSGGGKVNYSRMVNKNLEYLLFDYNIINKLRRRKANMNYTYFSRASGDVAISENGQYLFFKPTVLPDGINSSYAPVTDNTINELVANLNQLYTHYKAEGFSEVYLSVIPNPATMLQPNGYNNLIPRVKNDLLLKMPYLDVYDIFKRNPTPAMLYRAGDIHWNNNGLQIWLGVVNTELRKKSLEYSR